MSAVGIRRPSRVGRVGLVHAVVITSALAVVVAAPTSSAQSLGATSAVVEDLLDPQVEEPEASVQKVSADLPVARAALAAQSSATASLSFGTQGQGMWGSGPERVAATAFNESLFHEEVRWDIRESHGIFEFNADIDGKAGFGVYGDARAEGGGVDIAYPTTATAEALNTGSIKQGDTFVLRTSEIPGAATMTTDFAEVSARVGMYGYIWGGVGAYVELFTSCVVCPGNYTSFGGYFEQELLAVGLGDGNLTLDVFGQRLASTPGVDLAPLLPSNPIPWDEILNLELNVPDLDTGPVEHSTFDGDSIRNTRLPVARPDADPTDIDVLKFGVDVDAAVGALISGGRWTTGGTIEIVPGFVEVEAVDLDVDSFWGIGQTFEFFPNLMAVLTMSQPTLVESAPGSGTFTYRQTKTVPVGSDIRIVHPGGDFTIDVAYSLDDNVFFNNTDVVLDLTVTPKVVAVDFDLPSEVTDVLGDPDFCLWCPAPLVLGPLSVANISNGAWPMRGFVDQPGGRLVVPAVSAPSLSTSLEVEEVTRTVTLNGRISDQNAGETFTLELYWDDPASPAPGNYQPLQLGLNPIDAGGVMWNPARREFTVTHTYPPGTANDTFELLVVAIDSTFLASNQRRLRTTFIDPAPRLDLIDFNILDFNQPLDGTRTVTLNGRVTDGNVGDTFTIDIDWGDGNTETIRLGVDPIFLWDPLDGRFSPGTSKYFEIEHTYVADVAERFRVDGVIADGFGQSASDAAIVRFYEPRLPDVTPPSATITAPADGAVFERDALVFAEFECADTQFESGIESCDGTVPTGSELDTSSAGTKTLRVTALDDSGKETVVSQTYTVLGDPVRAVEDSGDAVLGTTTMFDVAANDIAVTAGARFRLTGKTLAAGVADIEGATGMVAYTPAAVDQGLVTLEYELCPAGVADGADPCDQSQLSIFVSIPSLVGLEPARLLETRRGAPTTIDGEFWKIGARAAGSVTELVVAGRGGVPDDAESVVLNVTVTGTMGPGFLTVYPCGSERPNASSVNFVAGQTIANGVVAKIGDGGKVCVFTRTETDLIADVSGYFPVGSAFTALSPARLLETRRAAPPTIDGEFSGIGARASGSATELQVAGRGGVPDDARSVVLNVTVTGTTGPGFITVYPCGTDRPNASSVNYVAGETIANGVIAKIGEGGKVCFFTRTATDLITDVTGYFGDASVFTALSPARVLETRAGAPSTVDGEFWKIGERAGGSVTELVVAGRGGVPADASSVVLNVTVTGTTGPGFLTVYPCGAERPNASTLNFVAGQTIANGVVAKIGDDGKVCVFARTATHLIADVNGYFPVV